MNKAALKRFATNARVELLERVELQARKIGITEDEIKTAQYESSDAIYINDRQLSAVERKQRDKLIARIDEIGFKRVMEETAYTWFNRFVALRFMEVNEYLPTKVRVLSSAAGDDTEPDMIKEALTLDLEIDKEHIYNLKMENNTEELFKYLIKLHCNDLNRYMPFMFETIEDYTAILFPEGLLGKNSFIREMTDTDVIVEADWEQVEIIGWLYQFYIEEKQRNVFKDLEKNIKITQETLPASTQLFTPEWIVKYLVENSLGKIWAEANPQSTLMNKWKYYLEEANQAESVADRLKENRYKNLQLEDLKFLDPACGSAHILLYAFDVFYEMYYEQGYIQSEIPKLILEKNLYGIDVDDRAAQLAAFALMMKARERSRKVFRDVPKLNIISIQDSNWLTNGLISSFSQNNKEVEEAMYSIKDTYFDAKEYGSLINSGDLNSNLLLNHLSHSNDMSHDLIGLADQLKIEENLPGIIKQSEILQQKYDIVCTNPPYLGRKHLGPKLRQHLADHYEDGKAELYAAFILRCMELTKKHGFTSMVTIHTWMFISSYCNLRKNIFENSYISTMIHTGPSTFEELNSFNVLATAFNLRKAVEPKYNSLIVRLVDYIKTDEKISNYHNEANHYILNQSNLNKIPNASIVYWITDNAISVFDNQSLRDISPPRQGLATGNNSQFVRYWHEVNFNTLYLNARDKQEALDSGMKWFPYNKGGNFRKWYGNNEDVLAFDKENYELLAVSGNKLPARQFYFNRGITWSLFGFNNFSVRYKDNGFIFDVSGSSMFPKEKDLYYVLSFLASKVAFYYLSILAPTVNFQVGNIGDLPFIKNDEYNAEIKELAIENINISKEDWDDTELSWDFSKHPFLNYGKGENISAAFAEWDAYSLHRHDTLRENEERINELFIQIYGLTNELTPEVVDRDIALIRSDLERDIKSFISYAIGCLFGRYSLDEGGLIYAGGDFDARRYQTLPADEDNILPILPGTYFEDDIVTRFIQFVQTIYGEDSLEENLTFIADALGRRKNETAKEAIRRYFLNDLYKNHVQMYKKHPIYWLFTSGKEKAFNCLIYMHRYDKTTLSRIRTDYLHDVQTRYDAERKDLLVIIDGDSTSKEIRDAKKELKAVEKKIDELREYDETLHHMADKQIEINLDAGVKENYKGFKGLVAKI